MRFCKKLYSKGIRWPNIVKYKLKRGIGQLGMYVICLNGGSDQLDIYPSALFKQRAMRKHPFFVSAIVKDYEDAMDYILEMADLSFKARGDYRIKEYILDNEPDIREHMGSCR